MVAAKMKRWESDTKKLQSEALSMLDGMRSKNNEIDELKRDNRELKHSHDEIKRDRDDHAELLSKLKPRLYKLSDQVYVYLYIVFRVAQMTIGCVSTFLIILFLTVHLSAYKDRAEHWGSL